MKQSNSACILLTVLVLVLAGREVQRTFLPSSITPLRGVSVNELADVLDLDAWSFTLPQEIKSERAEVTLNWYLKDDWGDEEGVLINTDCTFYINKSDAGSALRLLIQKTEKDTYKVWMRGPGFLFGNGLKNPYTDRELVGLSTDPSAGWDEDLITFSSNPSAESGQAREYWALRASFEESTPEQEAEFEKMIEDSQKDN
ncbi:MAG: hypothetical protein OSB14_05900 [Planctomycetota bacterium]|nr:hypothetical protein [Planctomycetota bacterium]